MTLIWLERILRGFGALTGFSVLTLVFFGLFRGVRQPIGRTTGRTDFLRSSVFYVIISLLYFGLCVLIWRPLGIPLTSGGRIVFLISGAVIFFAGLGLVLWGRLTLGKLYFGSTSMGAQLFEEHRLVTTGPFAFVRHPMYIGLLLVGIGGVLLYQTWTMVFFVFNFPGLVVRARREEELLAAEFGREWLAYRERVAPWLPRLSPIAGVLVEFALLFLPAVPAFLWFWPNASGTLHEAGQIVSYVYFGLGALWIGRRWPLSSLGFNRRGIWLGLACGAVLVIARSLILLGVSWNLPAPVISISQLIAQTAFYIGLVGLVEELLFRGVIYRALEDWLNTRWAIWLSSLAFGLWHIFGQGVAAAVATFFYGLIFALIRFRAGGIIGVIFAHGIMDLATFLIVSEASLTALQAGRPELDKPGMVFSGVILLILVPIYLWKVHDKLKIRRSGTANPAP